MDFKKLFRPHILDLKPYTSARDEYSGSEGVFLDANENPLGSVASGNYNRYPDPYQWEIKKKLADLKKVGVENIFLGNGSDEAIDLIILATCSPQVDEMIILPPTYGMYQVCADIHQAQTVAVPLTANFQINLDALRNAISSKTKLVWFCSPNNPSGGLLERNTIETLLNEFPQVLMVVDEAYIDFAAQPSMLNILSEKENLLVLQTFSKAWGMAGLRVGMAFGHTEIIKVLNKIKYPYNLNVETQRLVLNALNNEKQVKEYVQTLNKNREWLKNELELLPDVTKVHSSDSNQLLVKFKNSTKTFEHLLKQKVIVRDRSKVLLCEDCLRISIGSMEENKLLLEHLKKA